ncbi:hypothetical protein CC1G_09700 [Coprinopsis cinerea okayama7|uniref:Uncharacterized protein n=1 Tax=Coprinopsis cinerea (strain Okayama-7 / 130 / ATCC MYA-4618 / FGSC 9003) TaxID=240176 RepID=A8NJD5_COPC7|nr:hypothetical protein CC1G_09700 [Coprinopsis cinerea okayama7\|eukprot:XP_001834200.1 hypothetical protein CC1G_09700 [Coprinopsis cinerea okayama7\
MSIVTNIPVPMIPVLDERLVCPTDGAKDHRSKIEIYNELLESLFHRELELSKLKESLLDMRTEIIEEAPTLDTNGAALAVSGPATELEAEGLSESAEESDGTGSGVVSSASDSEVKASVRGGGKRKRGSKGKYKGKGRERVRISGEELGALWDYEVSPSKRQRVRRVSNAGESDVEGEDAL